MLLLFIAYKIKVSDNLFIYNNYANLMILFHYNKIHLKVKKYL